MGTLKLAALDQGVGHGQGWIHKTGDVCPKIDGKTCLTQHH